MPLVADAHGAELQGRHTHAREGRECTITSELGGRGRRERPKRSGRHLKRIGELGDPNLLFVLRSSQESGSGAIYT